MKVIANTIVLHRTFCLLLMSLVICLPLMCPRCWAVYCLDWNKRVLLTGWCWWCSIERLDSVRCLNVQHIDRCGINCWHGWSWMTCVRYHLVPDPLVRLSTTTSRSRLDHWWNPLHPPSTQICQQPISDYPSHFILIPARRSTNKMRHFRVLCRKVFQARNHACQHRNELHRYWRNVDFVVPWSCPDQEKSSWTSSPLSTP